MRLSPSVIFAFALLLPQVATSADDRFAKDKPDSMNGFLVVADAGYAKECGACHIAYSPGLLPADSWRLIMSGLDKHFGESVKLAPAVREAIGRYLADNSMDKSPYEGSKVLVERLAPGTIPSRIMLMPFLAYRHAIIREGIAKNGKIQVKRLSNCSDCHMHAGEGSYALGELVIPGLTRGAR